MRGPRTYRLPGVVTLAAIVLAGCTQASVSVPSAVPQPTATVTHGSTAQPAGGPPPFVVRYEGTELIVPAVTFCWSGASTALCVDGADPDPASVGSSDEIFVLTPPGIDELSVSLSFAGDPAGDRTATATESLRGGWWAVHLQGPPGDYVVELTARGGGNDMISELRWVSGD